MWRRTRTSGSNSRKGRLVQRPCDVVRVRRFLRRKKIRAEFVRDRRGVFEEFYEKGHLLIAQTELEGTHVRVDAKAQGWTSFGVLWRKSLKF